MYKCKQKTVYFFPFCLEELKQREFSSSSSQSSYQKTCRESADWTWSVFQAITSAEMFGNGRSVFLIYSHMESGSWVFNGSLESAA